MTAPAFESFASESSGSTAFSGTCDKPSGVVAGDLMIAIVGVRRNITNVHSAPSGWTKIYDVAGGTVITASAWYKIAGSSEPSDYTWTWTGQSATWSIGIARYTGHDASTPIDASASAGGSENTGDSPTVTTTVADTRVLRSLVKDRNESNTDAPSGNTSRWDFGLGGTSAAHNVMVDAAIAAIGATGAATWTWLSNRSFAAGTIAIAPAAGGGTAEGSGSVTAIGNLTGSGSVVRSGSGSFGAVGDLLGTGQRIASASGPITAIGDLDGTGLANRNGSGSFDAIGDLLGTGQKLSSGSGLVSAIGDLVGAGQKVSSGSGPIAAVGNLLGTGLAPTLGDQSGSGSVTAIGTLAASGQAIRSGSGSFDAIGVLTGEGLSPPDPVGAEGSGSVTAVGDLVGQGTTIRSGSGSFGAVGELSGMGRMIAAASGEISAVGNLVGVGSNQEGSLILQYYTLLLSS